MSATSSSITLRPAEIGDAETVFQWRNDPFILARGSSRRTVSWVEHQKWFTETLEGSSRKIFVILHDAQPIGQVRFDQTCESDCVISVYLLRKFTGRGFGIQAIRRGCAAILKDWNISRVIACVRSDNSAGHSAFRKAGFGESDEIGLCPAGHRTFFLATHSDGRVLNLERKCG